jgi:aspartate/methionine/tyrosine aminotransferase
MPRYPELSPTVTAIGGSVFSALARRLSEHPGEVFPLHVGDTWMEPAPGCRMEDFTVERYPGMHRYAPPQGLPALLEAVAGRVSRRTGAPTSSGEVLVAAGATGALGAAVGALVSPGEEVLLVAPYWPLIAGIVRSFHGVPVAVPVLGEVDSPEGAVEALDRRRTERTVALYLNTPNNPTGRVLPRAWVEALVEWASQRELWILADEVYEDYCYSGEHTYCRSLAPERTFAAHSFSKAYGMAGNRCGYVVGPEPLIGALRKVSTHTFYSTPTASQLAALEVLGEVGDAWVASAREQYRELGAWSAARLRVPPPEGSTFLFLDLAPWLDDSGLEGFLGRCADRGLFLAPGPSFGPYPTHARLCFTSAAPEVVRRGVEALADLLGR